MAQWNLWHGCTKVSSGCSRCYVYRRDAEFGRATSIIHKTGSFNLPVRKDRHGNYKLQPDGEYVYTCFTSDFFHPAADEWRSEAWSMMKERPDLQFFFITKRPERFSIGLPDDWGAGYENVHISCTCENQQMANRRLPVFLELPIRHKQIASMSRCWRRSISRNSWRNTITGSNWYPAAGNPARTPGSVIMGGCFRR